MRLKLSPLSKSLLLLPVVLFGLQGHADSLASNSDALEFHELMRASLPTKWQDDVSMSQIHILPDANITAATHANSIQEAIELVKKSTLAGLMEQTQGVKGIADNPDAILAKHPLTIVIMPGIFGEFINVRAFEEVLSQPSKDRDAFVATVASRFGTDPNASDTTFDFQKRQNVQTKLSDLVNVGSITGSNGQTLARVVLMFTPKYSLESLGTLQQHAQTFMGRLQKYLALTGDQDLVFLGYSRGGDTALEMLAEAKKQNLSWLKSVKAMISLSGVTWGSTLADNVENPGTPMSDVLKQLDTLNQKLDPNSRVNSTQAWLNFINAAAPDGAAMLADLVKSLPSTIKQTDLSTWPPTSAQLNFLSLFDMAQMGWQEFGLNNWQGDYSNNVARFKTFLTATLSGVQDLASSTRQAWWTANTLPSEITYYAVAGVMADPNVSAVDKSVFNGPYGYSQSYDDSSLLSDHRDYQTSSGLALNDSQVSVAQVMFLPQYSAQLNPANAGLKTEFLGELGTHHWGLALEVVNVMKDGRTNPFPRAALLKALAAKVSKDLQK